MVFDCNCDYLSNVSPTCICEPSISTCHEVNIILTAFIICCLLLYSYLRLKKENGTVP